MLTIIFPQSELYVSDYESDGLILSARFVTEYHPESNSSEAVLCVKAQGARDVEKIVQFLEERRESSEAVYIGKIGTGISIESEFGDTVEIQGESVVLSFDEFNAHELKEILARVYAWYQSENKSLKNAMSRINSARALMHEQARRVEVKAAAHGHGSTAATLYTQQLTFMSRILAVLNSSTSDIEKPDGLA